MLPEELARRRTAEFVFGTWKRIIKKPFFRMVIGPKTVDNAVQFYSLSQRTGVTIEALLKEGKDFYSPDWCQETFGSPYPPLNVVVGPKCRKRLNNNHRPVVYGTKNDKRKLAEEIADSLSSAVSPEERKVILDGGWPEDKEIRQMVKEILNVT